ncbi:hypothetical protein AKJ42_03785 [candidate division MSBL1 archaeon SCGC-AAA261C02]|uniref:N-sulphoglucosamine sulphohydrolase C-terminal domain-containing protein n=1 Tax=candidate division MSBL1 archaeon SCGC-AAA261C02 TaxID=1698272 RepID=A0A133UY03_9EURY|nr:hypothetical protein AKJ42_03785 [candidate division MSBL1 archaeon SCGC-AAA261C02]
MEAVNFSQEEEGEHVGVRTAEWKLVVNAGEKELYSLRKDPGEKVNLYREEREVAGGWKAC